VERLRRDHPELHLLLLTREECDLTSLDEVRRAARRVNEQVGSGEIPPLHGFLGNAGVQLTRADTATVDGVETTFAVNVLANYVLLTELKFAAPGRIVITGSDTHFGDLRHNLGLVPGPKWDRVERLATPGTQGKGRRAYATSKLAVIYLVHALARRLPEGVDIYTHNPGLVPGTGLARDANALGRFVFRSVLPLLRATPFATDPKTAGDLLAAAVAGPRPGESGSYIDRGTVTSSSRESYDETRSEALLRDLAELARAPRTPSTAPPSRP
jgi:NAD(P)-dependent dehydrogenase (short-subunit alcohol dehydrogenase family)